MSLLALPESAPASLYGLFEVFASVGVTWAELTGSDADVRRMQTRIVAARADPFVSPIGLPVAPHAALSPLDRPDVVIVTDLILGADADPRGRWGAEAEWVRRRYDDGALICSVCTGSIFLAETGLLDGRDATTHWSATDVLRAFYPDVRVHPDRILCAADPEQRLLTGGGASSWEDLALHLIARFCGPEEAVHIAKIFVFGDRSDGQLPFASMVRRPAHSDAVVRDCQAWIAEHYDVPNPVGRMVARSGLPERTFKRRFKAATGYTPVDYVQALRIEEARQLLETTEDPTDAVAHMVGYEDPAFFRRLFKRRTGLTPARYRRRFRPLPRLPGNEPGSIGAPAAP